VCGAELVDQGRDLVERERRGRAARLAVRERFSWSAVSAQLAAVFEDVVADADRAPAVEA